VAPDESGTKVEEIPLGARRLKDLAVSIPILSKMIASSFTGDVDVALRVLDDLRRLGDANAARAVNARGNDGAVDLGYRLEDLRRLPRDDLHDFIDGALAVSGLMRSGVREEEVFPQRRPEWLSIAGRRPPPSPG
jgi:hypothetical protein